VITTVIFIVVNSDLPRVWDVVGFDAEVWLGLRRKPNSTEWYNIDGTPVGNQRLKYCGML
jgi:hypothetical protein